VPEGLSPAEVGKEIAERKKHTAAHTEHDGHDRWLSIVEALLLSLVAVLAAYSGYAAAKWGTESSVTLAKASAERTKANRADTEAIVTRTLDSASFNAWFTAFRPEPPPTNAKGTMAGQTADKYIRATVFLATVLFLVGISGHFRIRQARIGLIAAGGLLLAFAVTQLLGLPGPPA
jgi:hypothetical protein